MRGEAASEGGGKPGAPILWATSRPSIGRAAALDGIIRLKRLTGTAARLAPPLHPFLALLSHH